jgi:hypothetical protein
MAKTKDQLAKEYCKDVPYGEWDNPYEVCYKAGFDAAKAEMIKKFKKLYSDFYDDGGYIAHELRKVGEEE